MKKKTILFPILFTAILSLLLPSSCGKIDSGALSLGDEKLPPVSLPSDLSTKQGDILAEGNGFALDLTRQIFSASPEESFILSPLGIEMVLGMLHSAAAGDTDRQIVEALGFDGAEEQQVNDLYGFLLEKLPSADPKTSVELANAVLLRDGLTINPDYSSTLTNYYEALVKSAPMDRGTLEEVNLWCKEKTHGMIQSALDELSPSTLALLMNVLYFKGEWQKTFDKSLTSDGKFSAGNGKDVTVPMMHMELSTTHYYECGKFQKLYLPYGNGAFGMLIFLPRDKEDIGSMLSDLSPESLSRPSIGENTFNVELSLPRFETDSFHNLVDVLRKLGINDLFDSGKCDISGIFDDFAEGGLHVNLFLQKAKVKVNEEGSEAAAVTVGSVTNSIGPAAEPIRVSFDADHPFLYSIISTVYGTVLFTGAYQGE